MDIAEIQETLKDAGDYLNLLTKLKIDLHYAEQQIEITARDTEANIQKVFNKIVNSVTGALYARRDELLLKTAQIRQWGVTPLLECQKVVMKKIQTTTHLIHLGKELLEPNGTSYLEEFTSKSSLLGSLPEVPRLKEVPYLSFNYELSCENELIDISKNIGSVIRIAPVQISSIKEQPGGLLIKWKTSDSDEHISDIQEYQLQKGFGNIITEKHLQDNFRTCYIGPDTQFLLKDLELNQDYTFRVCCKFEGETQFSPWSFPEVALTNLKPFCWSSNNKNVILTNANKIATPLNANSSMLFSEKSEFHVGYSVEFTFLECDCNLNDMFVGVFTTDIIDHDKITQSESICVEANGSIYGSGCKKSTQFAPVNKGSKICFTCAMKDYNKLRINIDAGTRRVTYDWPIDGNTVYFGAKFNSSKWKVMIN